MPKRRSPTPSLTQTANLPDVVVAALASGTRASAPDAIDWASSYDAPPTDVLAAQGIGVEPERLLGERPGALTPLELYALTQVVRTDVDVSDDVLWLTRTPVERIDKDGIHALGRAWWHPALAAFTTGAADAPPIPRFELAYDRAALARGVLREVTILEVLPDGRTQARYRCHDRATALQHVHWDAVVAHRQEYVDALVAKRALREREFTRLMGGLAAADALERLLAERALALAGAKPNAVVATPISAEDDVNARRLREALSQASTAHAAPGDVPDTTPELDPGDRDRPPSPAPRMGRAPARPRSADAQPVARRAVPDLRALLAADPAAAAGGSAAPSADGSGPTLAAPVPSPEDPAARAASDAAAAPPRGPTPLQQALARTPTSPPAPPPSQDA